MEFTTPQLCYLVQFGTRPEQHHASTRQDPVSDSLSQNFDKDMRSHPFWISSPPRPALLTMNNAGFSLLRTGLPYKIIFRIKIAHNIQINPGSMCCPCDVPVAHPQVNLLSISMSQPQIKIRDASSSAVASGSGSVGEFYSLRSSGSLKHRWFIARIVTRFLCAK